MGDTGRDVDAIAGLHSLIMETRTETRPRHSAFITAAEQRRQRDVRAARLRAMRFDYDEIARQLGYVNRSGAWKAVQRAQRRAIKEPTQDLIALDIAEFEEMAREAWAIVRREHFVVDRGAVVYKDGKALRDDAPILAAIARLIDISNARAKRLGLNAPDKASIKVITESDVDAAIRELSIELGHPAEAA